MDVSVRRGLTVITNRTLHSVIVESYLEIFRKTVPDGKEGILEVKKRSYKFYKSTKHQTQFGRPTYIFIYLSYTNRYLKGHGYCSRGSTYSFTYFLPSHRYTHIFISQLYIIAHVQLLRLSVDAISPNRIRLYSMEYFKCLSDIYSPVSLVANNRFWT